MLLQGRPVISGAASGKLLFSDVPLSFWAGVDPQTGRIIDNHHPLCGSCVSGCLLAVPTSRGSCSGSMVLLELLLNERAPAGLIFQEVEQVITLGAIVGKSLFDELIPVIILGQADFVALRNANFAAIKGREVETSSSPVPMPLHVPESHIMKEMNLTERDQNMLDGREGAAVQVAMQILLSFAGLQGASQLISVSRAHIDACIYTGPASLHVPQLLLNMGAKVAVQTTLNSISIDQHRWKEIGMDPEFAAEAGRLAECYLAMGATPSFTCAPYLLDDTPGSGEDIGWAESNAVVFANSVLGARTQKYPDFIDVCIALTGRAPLAGAHCRDGRLPTILIDLTETPPLDDSFYPLLGYHVGKLVGSSIPFISIPDEVKPNMSDLKAFSAAFGTTASAPMFHMRGTTPEAEVLDRSIQRFKRITVDRTGLFGSWCELNTAADESVGLISLGNPHFSLDEFDRLARLCVDREKNPNVKVMITTNREIFRRASAAGFISILQKFGASVITDTCWCMIGEPVIHRGIRNIMTNSAKYAHYAPGMVNRGVHFGSLAQCVDASCTGTFDGWSKHSSQKAN